MAEVEQSCVFAVPEVKLSSSFGHRHMPVIGMGLANDPFDEIALKQAVLESIRLGYRHFDSASMLRAEKPLGEALAEAIQLGLVSAREEFFVTSKLWVADAHPDLVVPALQKSLRTLQLEYLDLYLIHWPISAKPGNLQWSIPKEELQLMDYKSVWGAMEECQRLGLTKSIGVSNFSCKKLENIFSSATIPPSVNQVEMNPLWQQKKLREFCKATNVIVTAFMPLGAIGTWWGSNHVLDNETLKAIAKAHEKTVAQVCLRWLSEQGATFVVKSFNKERMKQNLQIFDWELTKEDHEKINQIPQRRFLLNEGFISPNGPFKTLDELWDGEL
ncbi:hypothetical protein SLE2022_046570 [Rubroshorea leprosula]